MRNVLYLDTSAIAKLILGEAESSALRTLVAQREHLVSSVVGEIETRRAVARVPDDEGLIGRAMEQTLLRISVVPMSDYIVASAAALSPPELRTLDAIHLATALALAEDLEGMAVYDHRFGASSSRDWPLNSRAGRRGLRATRESAEVVGVSSSRTVVRAELPDIWVA